MRTVDLDSISAEDLAHLLALKRGEEQRAVDAAAAEIAARDELRSTWRDRIPNLPTIGYFRSQVAA